MSTQSFGNSDPENGTSAPGASPRIDMIRSMQPGIEPIPGYRLRRFIGKGGNGEVWETEAPGGVTKALKITPAEGDALAERELEGLQKIRSIRHPFLLAIDRFERVGDYLIIVMELADFSLGDRFSQLLDQGRRGLDREEVLHYLCEAAEVLDLLARQHGLQHLDVKPNNLLVVSGHVKVADFGLLQPTKSNLSQMALAFSPGYAPPEIYDGEIHYSADQYGLAVTYQELLTGTRPFASSNIIELACEQRDRLPNVSPLPMDDQIIVRRALHKDPNQRFDSSSDFIAALDNAGEFVKSLSESRLVRYGGGASGPVTIQPGEQRPTGKSGLVRYNQNVQVVPGAAPVKPQAVGNRPTTSVGVTETSSVPAETQGMVGEEFRASFMASLPMEVYAIKLRTFIDVMEAELVGVKGDSTILCFRPRGWLGIRSRNGIFLRIDNFCRNKATGFNAVDIKIWSTIKKIQGKDLAQRGLLLMRCLKACLMASEEHASYSFEVAAVKSQLFGEAT